MIDNSKTDPESNSIRPSPERASPRKPYMSPSLLEWGSIVDLTGGPLSDINDDGFSSSGGQ
jgi:hypothetical protein